MAGLALAYEAVHSTCLLKQMCLLWMLFDAPRQSMTSMKIYDVYDIHIYNICLYTLQYKKGVQIESIKHLMLSLKMELTMELCFLFFFAICFTTSLSSRYSDARCGIVFY